MTSYRAHLSDGTYHDIAADRCRKVGAHYLFERRTEAGGWHSNHTIAVADVVQLQDGPYAISPHPGDARPEQCHARA